MSAAGRGLAQQSCMLDKGVSTQPFPLCRMIFEGAFHKDRVGVWGGGFAAAPHTYFPRLGRYEKVTSQ